MKNRTKKTYLSPKADFEKLEAEYFFAASGGLSPGGIDGKGDHGFGGAKKNIISMNMNIPDYDGDDDGDAYTWGVCW